MAAKTSAKPKKTRQATHGPALAIAVRCPNCGSSHVVRTQSRNGMQAGTWVCARCSTFFS